MAGINKVILVGNLGQNPELRYTPTVWLFVLSAWPLPNRTQIGRQASASPTPNGTTSSFGGAAETAGKYLKTGSQCYIEGKLKTRQWQDQQGQNRYTTEVVADVLQLLGPAPNRDNQPQAAPAAAVQEPAQMAAQQRQQTQHPSPPTRTTCRSDRTPIPWKVW